MKKRFIAIYLFCFSVIMANAQIVEGFYHIKNANTGRYMSFNDTDPGNYPISQSGSINMAGIRTILSYDSVAVSPSCVIFVKQIGDGKYNLVSQGSSLYAMTKNNFITNITAVGDGSYTLSGTCNGYYKELTDRSPSDEDGYIMGSGSSGMNKWIFLPINTTDEYIGIHPDIRTAKGSYFGTIFAAFNFKFVSSGMAAYYVNKVAGSKPTLTRIEDEVIPAGVPVIVRCNSANSEDNKIEPILGVYNFIGNNWLGGEYCSLVGVAGHTNATPYNPETMRVLGLNNKREIAFINAQNRPELLVIDKYGSQYLRGNKAYLIVNSGDPDVLTPDFPPQCITPEISLVDGIISFSCETEGAECHWSIVGSNSSGIGTEVQNSPTFTVSVYASKAGLENSDVTSRIITVNGNGQAIVKGDVDGNGVVNVGDHVELSKVIMDQK